MTSSNLPTPVRNPAWELPLAQVLTELRTDAHTGLTAVEAGERLLRDGPNELPAAHRTTALSLFVEQFKNIFVVILGVAIALSLYMGNAVEAITIGVIMAFAIVLGFIQELRAEKAIDALRAMTAPHARAIRDGAELKVPAHALVPGDVVLLATGDRVPADGRLIEASNLEIDEAPLTGESCPTCKSAGSVVRGVAAVGDRHNMVHSSTTVTRGRGRVVLTGTGAATEVGHIAGMLREVKTARTPLQKDLDRVGRVLAVSALAATTLVVALGLVRGQPWLEMVLFGIALAVAVVPESLPAVVTVSLAIGVQKVARRNALVRRLPAVETLGATTVICSDKTGTLTKDQMTVQRVVMAGAEYEVTGVGYEPEGELLVSGAPVTPPPQLIEMLRAAVLASDAEVVRGREGRAQVKGDPTEGALLVVAQKAGIDIEAARKDHPRLDEIPFSSESRRMTTIVQMPDGPMACAKGAPEVILGECSMIMAPGGARPLDDEARRDMMDAAGRMAESALRVLAVAGRHNADRAHAEEGLTFLGLVGMMDPPRAEAADAVRVAEDAGIRVMMITGDHPATARAIAGHLNLMHGRRVVTGEELQAMSDGELDEAVMDIAVFARVSPADKLRVVTALQDRGQVVAMTGDGVNDAPALKKADIGVAMGLSGTDVAREAAAMTLADDNFASIVAAVEEGRAIFGNIKKYLMYLLSSNIGEIGLMTLAVLAGLPAPLSAVQILYVNLATDGLPALALSVDPHDDDVMKRPPRKAGAGILTRDVVLLTLVGGAASMIANLALYAWALSSGRSGSEAMTMTFISLVLVEFVKAYVLRTTAASVFSSPLANRWLNLAVAWEIGLLLALVYTPFMQGVFGTFSLTAIDWLAIAPVPLAVGAVLEIVRRKVRASADVPVLAARALLN